MLSHENEHELCSFCRFSGIIIRGPNRSEKHRHLCRWDDRLTRNYNPSQKAAFFTKSEHTIKSHPQFPRSTWGMPGFLHRYFPVFRNINLRTPVSFGMLFRSFSLQQVSSSNSQDNFQICCADMYLVRFLANFAGFGVFLWISQDIADLLEIRGSVTARNIRCLVLCSWAGHLTITVPLSTQVYKWVPAKKLMLGVTLRWTSIPSRGE